MTNSNTIIYSTYDKTEIQWKHFKIEDQYISFQPRRFEGRDTNFPIQPLDKPNLGHTYFDVDKLTMFYYSGKEYIANKQRVGNVDTANYSDFLKNLIFYKLQDNCYYCFSDHLLPVDMYLYYYLQLKNVESFVSQLHKRKILLYYFSDKMDLAIFQMLMANQIKE